ncbi:MAG: serine hydroxymethyltransferase [Chloroflexi bacterium]|nr:MAG: serine hydroxymethyltransferase [Chloroflexota bacterium]
MTDITPAWFEPEALAFRQRVLESIEGLSPLALVKRVEQLNHEQVTHLSQHCLNLYPGTNIMSPRVAALLSSTIATRASEGHPGAKYQTGLRWSEETEVVATELVRRLFDANYAEVRTMSGSMANMAVLNSLTEPGDVIFSLSTSVGGHISHQRVGAAGYRRLEIHTIPYDAQNWEIKLDELRREVKAHPPKLIIVGASLILFPYPVREIRAIADEVGAWLMYDAAHVAGLIAGGVWQHPLREGAHVMTASTYKSFGGPPGGIVVTDDPDIAHGVDRAIFPGMTANFHTNRLPALAVAAAEMLAFGQDYARACVDNAQALAAGFKEAGLTVAGERQGYTAGHMLALDVSAQGGGKTAVAALESAHIICNMNLLPWDPLRALHNPSGVRLAVHEVTRWGMGPQEMARIAQFFGQVLLEKRSVEEVRTEVMALKAQFDKVRYCFDRVTAQATSVSD